jgi:hypothetical protein
VRSSLEPRRSTSLVRGSSPSPRVPILAIEPATEKLSIRETAEVAAWWSAVWFIANWAVNASLAWTSVASVTILSSTSGEVPDVLDGIRMLIGWEDSSRWLWAGYAESKL